jgi:hypothetical protein
MKRGLQRRISQVESRLPAALERQRKRREQLKRSYSSLALIHATAVAAIVLYGEPKIDEPLIRAWIRALDYYESGARVKQFMQALERSMRKSDWTSQACAADNVDDDKAAGRSDEWGEDQEDRARKLLNKPLAEAWKDYVDATDRIRPLGSAEYQLARFTKIFKNAPLWLLNFTSIFLDAKVLKFDLPDLSGPAQWGKLGRRDARRWPMLPVGVMTAGDPIPQETDVSADPSIDELLFALEATNRPPWEWTRRERLVIESLSARNIDEGTSKNSSRQVAANLTR